MNTRELEMEPWFRHIIELPIPSDICSAAILEAIDLLPTLTHPAIPYYLMCAPGEKFDAYLAVTPIEGADIKVEECFGYITYEWSLELRGESMVISVHSEGIK